MTGVRIFKVLIIETMGRYAELLQKHDTRSPRVPGSIHVRGNFFAEFILLQYNSGSAVGIIYFRETFDYLFLKT